MIPMGWLEKTSKTYSRGLLILILSPMMRLTAAEVDSSAATPSLEMLAFIGEWAADDGNSVDLEALAELKSIETVEKANSPTNKEAPASSKLEKADNQTMNSKDSKEIQFKGQDPVIIDPAEQ